MRTLKSASGETRKRPAQHQTRCQRAAGSGSASGSASWVTRDWSIFTGSMALTFPGRGVLPFLPA